MMMVIVMMISSFYLAGYLFENLNLCIFMNFDVSLIAVKSSVGSRPATLMPSSRRSGLANARTTSKPRPLHHNSSMYCN
jgi:hypothetical protein